MEICCSLPKKMREELEDLFFFNPRQYLLHDNIAQVVEKHGMPRIIEESGRLRLNTERENCQCIFLLEEGRLKGVAIYHRYESDTLSLLHLAVHPDSPTIFRVVLAEFNRIAVAISGIEYIRIEYFGNTRIKVSS